MPYLPYTYLPHTLPTYTYLLVKPDFTFISRGGDHSQLQLKIH